MDQKSDDAPKNNKPQAQADQKKKKSNQLRQWASLGIQKQLRQQAQAEVFSVSGPDRKRETAAGKKTTVTQILNPRLKLTPQERAAGNCYGAFYEQAFTGGSSEFLREFVDGGSAAGGGYSERQAHIVSMITCAQVALKKLQPVTYERGKSRKKILVGRHLPVHPLTIIEATCVNGYSIDYIAITHQWVVCRKNDEKQTVAKRAIVPVRQRKRLSQALRDSLNVIADTWHDNGFSIPHQFGSIEVE